MNHPPHGFLAAALGLGLWLAAPQAGLCPPPADAPLSPADSFAKIHVRDGFEVELVASEPLLESPVAIDWDDRGRLWVVEMVDYPLGLDGKGKPGGRVRVLEDTDGDGRFDKTTLFADGLKFPTGILTWRDGVIVTAAPEILLLKDTNGDGVADERRVLFSGFLEGNQQLRVNALRWGLDNWVYCASGAHHGGHGTATKIKSHLTGEEHAIGSRDFRFKPDTGDLDAQSGPSQFGRNPDNWGDWFGVLNSWPLWHYVLQDHYIRRNPHVAAPDPIVQVVTPKNPRVLPASKLEKRFHSFNEAGHFTSACSGMIYRDELLFGSGVTMAAFTCEPFHNLVQVNMVSHDGVSFTSRRQSQRLTTDFFASEDRWCRPVMVRTGPDGALWVVDMYRYMIEHPEWLPAEGKAELLPHYRLGEERGRIYRVFPEGQRPPTPVRLGSLNTAQLVSALDSLNGWQRDKAQMMLIWKNDRTALAPLAKLASESKNHFARLHALCTLDGFNALHPDLVERALGDLHSGIRRNALRLAETRATPAVIAAAVKLVEDDDAKVRLQLACTLGEWREREAGEALARLAITEHTNKFIVAAVMSSAVPHVEALVNAVVNADAAFRARIRLTRPDGHPLPVGRGEGRGEGRDEPGNSLATYSESLLTLSLALKDRGSVARLLKPTLTPIGGQFSPRQMETFSAFLDTLARRGQSLASLAGSNEAEPLAARLAESTRLFAAAQRLMVDASRLPAERVTAAALLVRDGTHRTDGTKALAEWFTPKSAGEVQRAAIRALGVSAVQEVPGIVTKAWPALGPETRLAALDELLGRPAWALELARRIESGQIGASALDAARRGRLLRHSSPEVRQLASKALNVNAASSRTKVVEDFKPALTLQGDAKRGEAVHAKLCVVCHKLGDTGNDIGPNLQSVANHPPEKLLVSIFDPNASIEPGYLAYTAVVSGGEELYGIIAAETGNSLVLKLADGKTRTLLRSDIATLRSSNLSLMPEGLEQGLSKQDLADLIQFIRTPVR